MAGSNLCGGNLYGRTWAVPARPLRGERKGKEFRVPNFKQNGGIWAPIKCPEMRMKVRSQGNGEGEQNLRHKGD